MFEKLKESDEKLQTLYSQIDDLTSKLRGMEAEQAEARRDLKRLAQELEEGRRKARTRLVALYKFKQMSYAAPLFTVENFRTVIEASHLMARLIGNDQRFFTHLQNKIDASRSLERILEEREEELKHMQARLEARKKELMATKNHEIRLLQELRAKRSRRSAPPPEQFAGAVEEPFVYHSQTAPSSSPDPALPEGSADVEPPASKVLPDHLFSKQKGTLPLPTSGPVAKTYGHSKRSPYGGILYDKGIVIEAPKGQPVQALHDGVVVFSDWFKNYGKVMIIDHGEHYHSVIAHADQLLKNAGEKVKCGENIATVGKTGSHGDPRLYFELRHHGEPIDPAKWLAIHQLTRRRGN